MITDTSERPTFDEFLPLSPVQNADPYPVLARARMEQPVFYVPTFDFWVVTRYADVLQILGDPATYSSTTTISPRAARPNQIDLEFGDRQIGLHNTLVMNDPPSHTRLRKLISPAFLPRRMAVHEPWISAMCHRLIDAIAGRGRADLIADYAAIIPAAVITKVVGAPETDARLFARGIQDVFTLTGGLNVSEEDRIAAWRGVFAFEDYITALVADRRRHPAEDFTSDVIGATLADGTPALTDSEVMWNVFSVATAGADTTGLLIGQMIHLLLSHPDQLALLRDDPALIQNTMDETLRLRSPVRGVMRQATRDVVVGGVAIPAGAMILNHLAAANHDETVFEEPTRFDIRRRNANRNMGMGTRTHACIGGGLARAEVRIAIETLFERLPDLRLMPESHQLTYRTNLVLPAIERIDVGFAAFQSAVGADAQ